MEAAQTANAPQGEKITWPQINWADAHLQVRKIQNRIVKAVKERKWRTARNLQRLLTRSLSAKQLAVRNVVENTGKRTPGVDGKTWSSALEKTKAIYTLTSKSYKAQALKRVYIPKLDGRKRPLSIPTLKDRAMQALWKMALEPIAETLGDPYSYGFKPGRSAHDAIARCNGPVLGKKTSAEWVLDADIQSCFDELDHEWLLKNIPMNSRILKQWLKAKYLEMGKLHDTPSGTPQGGIISPIITNMALDGLHEILSKSFKRSQKAGLNDKVNMIRYADDFIITGKTAELLEEEVIPIVEAFLKERGLKLSRTKTKIRNIKTGFDFLGFNVRKYRNGNKNTLKITPSLKNRKRFKQEIKVMLKQMRTATQSEVVARLQPIVKGWGNYYRHVASRKVFASLDHWLWWKLWSWAKRRHPNKSRKWIKVKYFHYYDRCKWTFGYWKKEQDDKKLFRYIPRLRNTKIKARMAMRGNANPYDPADEEYFEARIASQMQEKLTDMVKKLLKQQDGRCQLCRQMLDESTDWQIHHIQPRHRGGKTILSNLTVLHPVCHRQIHDRKTAGLSIPDGLIHA